MSEIRFDNRVAIITGAGGGLGRTYALELARRGARVVVNDLGGATDGSGSSTTAADRVVDEIRAAGGQAVASHDSVATPAGGAAIVETAVREFDGVDIVINNAGILRDRTFAKLAPADLDAVLDVHLRGAFHVSQPAFRVMKDRGYGRFLFTSSGAGIFGNFGQSNYGAAKMGLVGLSNVLAVEGARGNIKSNVIAPIARTRMTEQLLGPLAELLDPEQVMPLACYLVSDECNLTHEVFSVGGGRYARIFIGLCQGWVAGKGERPSLEDVRDHMKSIMSTDGFIIPGAINDEMAVLMSALR
ncbi:MAG: SDR family oxidoreductase [Kofleriaceae bacterium]|nr:SDR family oxidoreductase [Myxococcales bacterium]MCB9563313.1 SDR family oxidoreductase [Kofleriaceae bacterium]MCB9572239.1 SDR family oxidoreductase [Kofleriaceae bacterium]